MAPFGWWAGGRGKGGEDRFERGRFAFVEVLDGVVGRLGEVVVATGAVSADGEVFLPEAAMYESMARLGLDAAGKAVVLQHMLTHRIVARVGSGAESGFKMVVNAPAGVCVSPVVPSDADVLRVVCARKRLDMRAAGLRAEIAALTASALAANDGGGRQHALSYLRMRRARGEALDKVLIMMERLSAVSDELMAAGTNAAVVAAFAAGARLLDEATSLVRATDPEGVAASLAEAQDNARDASDAVDAALASARPAEGDDIDPAELEAELADLQREIDIAAKEEEIARREQDKAERERAEVLTSSRTVLPNPTRDGPRSRAAMLDV
jgi:hypothetical protein